MNDLTLESLLNLINFAYCIIVNGKRFSIENYNGTSNAMFDDIMERYGKESSVKSFKQDENYYHYYDIKIDSENKYDGADLKRRICLVAQWEYYEEIVTTPDDNTNYEHELREKIKRGEITRNDADFTEVYESDRITW